MSNMDFDKTTPEVWLQQSQHHVTESLATDEWFILNIQETGEDLNMYTLCFCVRVHMRVCVCVHARTVHMQWTIFEGIL